MEVELPQHDQKEKPVRSKPSGTVHDASKFNKKFKLLTKLKASILGGPTLRDIVEECGLDYKQSSIIYEFVFAITELYVIMGLAKPLRIVIDASLGDLKPPPICMAESHWKKLGVSKLNKFIRRCQVTLSVKKIFTDFAFMIKFNGAMSWVGLLKWKFASFFSYHNDQDIPKEPELIWSDEKLWMRDPSILLGYEFKRFYEQASPSTKKVLTDSSLLLKKAMPKVPSEMVDKAVKDTVIDLTTVADELPDRTLTLPDGREITVTKAEIQKELKRTVRELFVGKTFKVSDLYDPFLPSVSANYLRSRSNGGALGELSQRYHLGVDETSYELGETQAIFFDEISTHYGTYGKYEQEKICSVRTALGGGKEEIGKITQVDLSDFRVKWKHFYDQVFYDAVDEDPIVEAVGLDEPLKVRVISKGPPLMYTALKPIQKWMWSVLKEQNVFRLISEPVSAEHVFTALSVRGKPTLIDGKEVRGKRFMKMDTDVIVSGDYTAATNKLHSWNSNAIIEELMLIVREELRNVEEFPLGPGMSFLDCLEEMLFKSLTGHLFSTPESVELLPQREGQLMGSITSFPILCIANAALCRMSIEKSYNKTFRLTNKPINPGRICPLLINGDDCIFTGLSKNIRVIWESLSSRMGLASSIGKTYFSKKFGTINSTIFSNNGDHFLEEKVINLGLMFGKSRTGVNDRIPFHLLGTFCDELKKTSPEKYWMKIKKNFIQSNYKMLSDKKYEGIPWFLPTWLGGVGLPIDCPSEITEDNLKVAHYLRGNLDRYKIIKPKDMPQWQMHKLAQSSREIDETEVFFRKAAVGDHVFNLMDHYQEFYKYQIIDLMFTQPLESLRKEADSNLSIQRAIFNNKKVLKEAFKFVKENAYRSKIEIIDLKNETKDTCPAVYVKEFGIKTDTEKVEIDNSGPYTIFRAKSNISIQFLGLDSKDLLEKGPEYRKFLREVIKTDIHIGGDGLLGSNWDWSVDTCLSL